MLRLDGISHLTAACQAIRLKQNLPLKEASMKITSAMLDEWNLLHLSEDQVAELQRRFDEWGCPTCTAREGGFLCYAEDIDYGDGQEIQEIPDCPKKSMTTEEIHKMDASFTEASEEWLDEDKEAYYEYPEVREDTYLCIKTFDPDWEPDPKRVIDSKK